MIRHKPASRWIAVHQPSKQTLIAYVEDGLLISDGDNNFFLYINSTHQPILLDGECFFETEEAARERMVSILSAEMTQAQNFIAERSAALANLQNSPLMGDTDNSGKNRPN